MSPRSHIYTTIHKHGPDARHQRSSILHRHLDHRQTMALPTHTRENLSTRHRPTPHRPKRPHQSREPPRSARRHLHMRRRARRLRALQRRPLDGRARRAPRTLAPRRNRGTWRAVAAAAASRTENENEGGAGAGGDGVGA